MRKLSDEEIAQAKHLRSNGASLHELGRLFNVHFTTIALWTGDATKRKEKLRYKRKTVPVQNPCPKCGARISYVSCSCQFPPVIAKYFFSPKDFREYNTRGG